MTYHKASKQAWEPWEDTLLRFCVPLAKDGCSKKVWSNGKYGAILPSISSSFFPACCSKDFRNGWPVNNHVFLRVLCSLNFHLVMSHSHYLLPCASASMSVASKYQASTDALSVLLTETRPKDSESQSKAGWTSSRREERSLF